MNKLQKLLITKKIKQLNNKSLKFGRANLGFTLIEIMVVLALMMIIFSIVVYQLSKTRKGIYVESTAEEIVLALRKAQSLALAVHSTDPLVAKYNNGYGVHFELIGGGGPVDAGIDSYVIFTDYEAFVGGKGWDRAYFPGGVSTCSPIFGTSECVEKTMITTGDTITKLEKCVSSGGGISCTNTNNLDITFLRPSLDASFCTATPGSGGCLVGSVMTDLAKITVTSPTGKSKVITVWSTGYISIE